MKKMILMMAIIMGSVSAFADIQWQVQNDEKGQRVERLKGFTIQGESLYIYTVKSLYLISFDVIESTGFSVKELMDLLNEYDAAKDKRLYFNASLTHGIDIDSIGALVIFPKK